jgi:hypothetical protein
VVVTSVTHHNAIEGSTPSKTALRKWGDVITVLTSPGRGGGLLNPYRNLQEIPVRPSARPSGQGDTAVVGKEDSSPPNLVAHGQAGSVKTSAFPPEFQRDSGKACHRAVAWPQAWPNFAKSKIRQSLQWHLTDTPSASKGTSTKQH